jgi:Adenylate and Guanylate cyclase catalytic domain
LGPTDLHDHKYDSAQRRVPFYTYPEGTVSPDIDHEEYTFYIYATSDFEALYRSHTPTLAAVAAACTFLLVVVALVGYESYIRQRDEKVTIVANVADGIVSSLFPSHIRALMFDESDVNRADITSLPSHTSRPIACYFPDTTVLFADVVGFTSWSAKRPPELVFMLLETLYGCFDGVAHRLGVYKVETIGDCYVAVTGLPDPQPLHAVVMTQFAMECLQQMTTLMSRLKAWLG